MSLAEGRGQAKTKKTDKALPLNLGATDLQRRVAVWLCSLSLLAAAILALPTVVISERSILPPAPEATKECFLLLPPTLLLAGIAQVTKRASYASGTASGHECAWPASSKPMRLRANRGQFI